MNGNWQKFQSWMTSFMTRLPVFAPGPQKLNGKNDNTNIGDFFETSLVYLFMEKDSTWSASEKTLKTLQNNPELSTAARFIWQIKEKIKQEIESADARYFADLKPMDSKVEKPFLQAWQVFFPEGVEICRNKKEAEQKLLNKRRIKITAENPQPLQHPAGQILFTSNVLLRPPLGAAENLDPQFKEIVQKHRAQPQQYWYDHPIPLDAPTENNEILYGLKGLDQALEFEKERGNLKEGQKVTCVLSCSVTHTYLHQLARPYVRNLIQRHGAFKNLQIYLITETDCRKIIEQILQPAARQYWHGEAAHEDFSVLGTDGEYGRHYSFLKAVAAFWHVLIDPEIEATFKIDLDQVFPQEKLVKETGHSALELFKTALWGAMGTDFKNRAVKLGMIAGALVNATDIEQSLFTPDVPDPAEPKSADEYIFFSKLPQALSTRVEMMTRYDQPGLDGRHYCLQRIHVTGGTNGILVKSLFDYRPFTPSFIGRAEDQAFILSVFNQGEPLLRYLHRPGLIMRHDKELFAQEAIRAAEPGKIIGDYQRVLYFSAYAKLIRQDIKAVKDELNPFTGCFISHFPLTVVMLRFLLKGLELSRTRSPEETKTFLQIGVERLEKTIKFVSGKPSPMEKQLNREQKSWHHYYDLLQLLKGKIAAGDPFALKLQRKARQILQEFIL